MKKSILAVFMLVAVAVFFVSCKEQPKEEIVVEATDTNTEIAMNDVYMCDMKCKEYAEPGNCECGMELKKVEPTTDSTAVEENHEGHNH